MTNHKTIALVVLVFLVSLIRRIDAVGIEECSSTKCAKSDSEPEAPHRAPVEDRARQYEEDYREALTNSHLRAEEVEGHVKDRVKYYRNAPNSVNSMEHPPRYQFDEGFYESQICGVLDKNSVCAKPPKDQKLREVLPEGAPPPPGCKYKDPSAIRKTLICDDEQMTDIPILPPALYEFELLNTQVKVVNRTDFGNITITSIKLRHNNIKEMQPWAFSNIKDITTLEISDNEVNYLAFDIYYGLTELATLNLDGNKISFEIYENCTARKVSEIVQVLPRLRILSLARNPLKILPAQIWAGLRDSELTLLDLSYCDLQYIHEDAFQYLPLLKILYLPGNPKLTSTSEGFLSAFRGLAGLDLKTLSLRANHLSTFPKEIFQLVGSTLTKLDVGENSLGYLKADMIPPNMTMLQTLNMFSCHLVDIEEGALDLFPKLLQLDLERNHLQTLPKFHNLPALFHITLADNIMDSFKPAEVIRDRGFILSKGTLDALPKLSSLILSGTKMKEISAGIFQGANHLQMVFLDNVDIQNITNGAFQDLENLRLLTLRENKGFKSVNSLTFKGLHNVTTLYASQCSLDFAVPEVGENSTSTDSTTYEDEDPFRPFKHMPNLYFLELAYNNITHLSPELFEGTSLGYLNLTGNRIKSWNVSLFGANYSIRRDNWFNPIGEPSAPPPSHLLLDYNDLTLLTDAMIDDIMSFKAGEVDVSNNRFTCNAGACKLRDLILSSIGIMIDNYDPDIQAPYRPIWLNKEKYVCIDPDTDKDHLILELEDEMCRRPEGTGGSQSGDPIVNSSWILILSVSTACGILLIAAVVGYLQRDHIRYYLFRAKMTVSKLPIKPKGSLDNPVTQYDYDLFISYHNEDRDFIVEKFLPEMENAELMVDKKWSSASSTSSLETLENYSTHSQGFRVCLHERDFEAGMPITENIIDSVDRSRKTVIAITKKYLESQWCTFEMNLAFHRLVDMRRNSLVLLLLEDIPASLRTKVLNYMMRSKTYIEWPGENAPEFELKNFWNRLRKSVQDYS